MSETAGVLTETARRLFEDHLDETALRRGAAGEWLGDAWAAIEAMGLPLALVAETQGGFGVDPAEAFGLVRLFGAYAAPLPLGETLLANLRLAEAGLRLAEGPAALAPASQDVRLARVGGDWLLTGSARRVVWSGSVSVLLIEADTDGGRRLVRLGPGQWRTGEVGANLAGHRRDEVHFDTPVQPSAPLDCDLIKDGAAIRTLQIAGALDRVLALTIDYVNLRVQFGRPLAKFQAVQHACAELAGEVAAADAAADMAMEALTRPAGDGALTIAAAKLRAGEAAGRAAAITHQLHGAIGFTAEHALHFHTKTLWAWREEFGGQRHWGRRLGARALEAGGRGFWPLVTGA